MIEQRGKAAAVICTEQFATSAHITAQTFGMAGYPFAEILHPIGRVSEKELSERADVAFPQVLAILERS
jgi:nitrate reductase gamma subunit